MILSEKQKDFINNANHRYNLKVGARRCGKTYLDNLFTIPSRIIERAGLDGLYVILGVVSIFCVFYLITFFVVVKEVDDTKYDDVSISVDNIIVGRSLSMSEEKYYVLYYDTKDEEINEKYSPIVSSYIYSSSEDKVKLYTVDMSDALNKKYASEESNTKPTTESEIAIKGTTLMVVENGEVVDYIEDQDRIKSLLQ